MPVVKDFRTTKKITLKSLEGSEIEIYSGILFRDTKVVDDLTRTDYDPTKLLKALVLCIKSWNFTDESGKDLPIDEHSLGLLRPDTIQELIGEITSFVSEKKSS